MVWYIDISAWLTLEAILTIFNSCLRKGELVQMAEQFGKIQRFLELVQIVVILEIWGNLSNANLPETTISPPPFCIVFSGIIIPEVKLEVGPSSMTFWYSFGWFWTYLIKVHTGPKIIESNACGLVARRGGYYWHLLRLPHLYPPYIDYISWSKHWYWPKNSILINPIINSIHLYQYEVNMRWLCICICICICKTLLTPVSGREESPRNQLKSTSGE